MVGRSVTVVEMEIQGEVVARSQTPQKVVNQTKDMMHDGISKALA